MAENSIKISRHLPFATVFLCWVFVFILPVLLLHTSLRFLFRVAQTSNKSQAAYSMINEMQAFKKDLQTTEYLDRTLARFFAGHGGTLDTSSPEKLSAKLKTEALLKVAGIISHSQDTNDIEIFLDEGLKSYVGILSKTILRRYLAGVNKQHEFDFLTPEGEVAIKNLFRFVDEKKSFKDAENSFRRIFALIANTPIIPGRTAKTFSSGLGGASYFYYWPRYRMENGKRYIDGGFLVLIRGSQLNYRSILRSARELASPGFYRSYDVYSQPDWAEKPVNREIITSFKEDAGAVHLLSTVSQSFFIDLIQLGTLLPKRLKEVGSNLPLLKVSVPMNSLQHPLHGSFRTIKIVSALFALLGGLFLLQFSLFGMEFEAGIRTKVVVGTVLILLLPILLLIAGYISWSQFSRLERLNHVDELQRQHIEKFYIQFDEYLTRMQRRNFDLAVKVLKMCNESADDATLEQFLRDWMKSSIASDLYFTRPDRPELMLRSPTFARPISADEESSRKLTGMSIVNSFDLDGRYRSAPSNKRNQGNNTLDSAFINTIINRWGRPFRFFQFQTGNRYSTIFLHNPDNFSVYGLVSLKVFDDLIVGDFINNHYKSDTLVETDFFLMDFEDESPVYTELKSSQRVKDSQMIENFARVSSSGFYKYMNSDNELVHITGLSDFPLILVTRGRNQAQSASGLFIPAALIGYCVALLLFLLLAFNRIYIGPIREFIRVTDEVAGENFAVSINLDLSNEFGELKDSFASMINGLEQRRKMTHFVSQEVVKAVESDCDELLVPGGEKVEATILFIELVYSIEGDDEEAVAAMFATLTKFMNVAEQQARLNRGLIDKVMETTLMMVFREGENSKDHCVSAAKAALAIVEQMKNLNFKVKGGMACGQVVSGRIGSKLGKLDFTVIGDTVNLAARLKVEAKKTKETGIVIAPGCIRLLKGLARVVFIERTEIKGKSREYPIYELTGLR